MKIKTEDEIFEEMWEPFLEYLEKEYPRKLDREIIAFNAFFPTAYRAIELAKLWQLAGEIEGELEK
jgi:hypothetical protein